MDTHNPYQIRRKQPEDFRVRYKFLRKDDGSYFQGPFQGMRCDFSYEHDDVSETGIYMIWPEFENSDGAVIESLESEINEAGTAKMWILVPEMRESTHRVKAVVGGRGYFMVGNMKIAEAEITELVGLHTNAN